MPISLTVYPAEGQTVLDADGVAVPTAGLGIVLSGYYLALIRAGSLKTYNPLTSVVETAETLAGSQSLALLSTNLTTRVGVFDRATVQLDGHTTALDGGGGPVTWYEGSATAADGGTVFGTTDEGRWKRPIGDYVTPEMFGAVGDGVTDDTEALQAALDTLKWVRCNPEATYLVSSQSSYDGGTRYQALSWTSYMKLDLQGATIKLAASQTKCSVFVSTSAVSGPAIRETVMINGVIDGNEQNQTAWSADITPTLHMNYHFDCRWENLLIENAYHSGFYCGSGERNYLNNVVVRGSQGFGFQIRPSSEWRIGSVAAYDCRYVDGTYVQGNGFIAEIDDSTIDSIYTENCAFGIKIQGSSSNLAFGNIVCVNGSGTAKDVAAIDALYGEMMLKFQGTDESTYLENISVGNITIDGAPGMGLYCFKARNLTIGNVALSNCGILQDDDYHSADFAAVDAEVAIASMTCTDTNQTAVSVQTTSTARPVRIGKLRVNTSQTDNSKTIKNALGMLQIDELSVYRRSNTTHPIIYASSASPNYTRVGKAFLDIDVDNVLGASTPLFQSYTGSPSPNEILLDQVEIATKARTEVITLVGAATSIAVANTGVTKSTTVFGPTQISIHAINAGARTLLASGGLSWAASTTGYTVYHPAAAGGETFLVVHAGYVAPYAGA